MNRDLSNKISFFHLFGILLVLPIHTTISGGENFELFRKMFILLCRSFQPIYFGIAGYLFFLGISESNLIEKFKEKIKSRFRSLFIPYILWNVIAVVVYIGLIYLGINSYLVKTAYEGLYESSSIPQLLHFIFVHPINEHLWFLGDLIFVSVISPLVYFGLKYGKGWFLLALILLVVVTDKTKCASLFSFSVGAWLAIFKIDVESRNSFLLSVAIVTFVGYIGYFSLTKSDTNIITMLSWSTAYLLWILYNITPLCRVNWGG